jgi:exodeoxyribonuclease VII large subunit
VPNDLFDLPFEAPEPEPARAPEPRRAAAAPDVRDDDGPAEPATERRVWSVSDLTAAIRNALESRFAEIWLEGEISNCRLWNTGHLYFTLKDSGAQIKAVMFRTAYRYLKFKPEDGLHVVARGRVSVYDPKGEYQIVCEHLEPVGQGALQLAFEQLKKRLAAEGLFDAARKRRLPALPRKIGIVTSLDGAAIRDIIKVISRRYPNAHLVIRPARVQGDGAASEIARALRAITRVPGVDVVIVGRGGGSIEDLWAFNEEAVARAIAQSSVPVISAVGHEVDFTIADFVADVRAPTPSAAAEIVVSGKEEFCSRIDRLAGRLESAVRSRVERQRTLLHRLETRPGLAGFPARIAMRGRHVAELTHRLGRAGRAQVARRARRLQDMRLGLETHDLRRRLGAVRSKLARAQAALTAAVVRTHHRADARLRTQAARLDSLSPLAVLGRGYAVCWDGTRTHVIRDAGSVEPGDEVRVTLRSGELECRVTKKEGSRR